MYALYLRKNNALEKTLYPFCEFDMEAAITASWGASFAISPPASYTGSDLTCWNIFADGDQNPALLPNIAACFDDDLIIDARSENQPYYFNADTYRDCFGEAETLAAEPADWTSTYNGMYYQEIYLGAGSCFMDQPYTFVAGTYYKNETLSGVYETDEGMAFGISIGYVYRNGQYWYDAIFGHKLMLDGYANLAEYWQYYVPQMTGFPSTRILGGFGTVEFNMGTMGLVPDTPDSPTNAGSMLVNGTYLGVDYYGCCMYRWDEDTGKCIAFRVYMLPAWCWGDPQEWVPPEPPEPVIPDPQDYGPDSWAEGGGGTLTDSNDAPDITSSYDFIDPLGAYGLHMYVVSDAAYGDLLSTLWGTGTLSQTLWSRWENYKFNPLQGILINHFVPSAFIPTQTNTSRIKLAGIELVSTAGIPDDQITTAALEHLSVPEFFGNAFDYAPYTQLKLYLPFCGWITVDPDRVVGGGLDITYKCDLLTGDVCAYVQCTDRTGSCTYMYTATGNCAVTLPVTGNDQGTGAALSGALQTVIGAVTGNAIGVINGVTGALTAQHHTQQTGSVSGNVANIADLQCRLQIIRPVLTIPQYGQQLRGRPSEVGVEISQLVGTGWNSFNALHPDIEGATADECAEIARLLSEGVIL